MFYTGDPVADFHNHDAAQEERLERLPECCECGQTILDEEAYYINNEWVCESCMSSYKRTVDVF